MDEDFTRIGEDLDRVDLEGSGLALIADLTKTKYESYTLLGGGDTGSSLRYFAIQPSTSMVCPT